MNTSKVQDQIFTQHLLCHINKSDIRAHGITILIGRPVLRWFCSYTGTVLHEGVVDIDIDRYAITLRLPIAWHSNLSPLAHIIIHLIK